MPELDRIVAGLRCRDVLGLLSDYVGGELPPEVVERVNAHLRGCDHCEKFGGEYGTLVGRLRAHHGALNAEQAGVRERLTDRLQAVWGSEDDRI